MRQRAMLPRMDYAEIAPPPELRLIAKCGWTLAVPKAPDAWRTHVATPDGCMELIRRLGGRSLWNGEQPPCFIAGVTTRPTELRLAAGSRFIGLRLWPWAWQALSGRSPAGLIDSWAELSALVPGLELARTASECFSALDGAMLGPPATAIAEAVLSARTVREICDATALSPRALQRWFGCNVGVPPRTYLRLLRFSETMGDLPDAQGSLADHAAGHGFADQAHMSREFRAMAGASAAAARKSATGPFLADPGNPALPS